MDEKIKYLKKRIFNYSELVGNILHTLSSYKLYLG